MTKTKSTVPVRVIEETSAYWRVVFDYPPFNIVDATIFEGLQELLARMDASPSLRVVVLESANPDFYLAQVDLTGKTGNITTAVVQAVAATSPLMNASRSALILSIVLTIPPLPFSKHNSFRPQLAAVAAAALWAACLISAATAFGCDT